MPIYDETLGFIDIRALDIMLLSSDFKEAIIQYAKLDEEYMQSCKAVSKGKIINNNCTLHEELLGWKTRIYVPKAMRKNVMKSEQDSKVVGPFGCGRTIELIS
jgi:hypothetical protein